jgi:hypothetical protein
MHEDESDLINRLRAWRIEGPPADLGARIAAEASRHAQQSPFGQRLAESLERLLTEWRYGLAVKAGALAVCVLVGFAVGQLGDSSAGSELDVVAIAFGQQDGWERGL